jgi:anti-anti-sigma factor
MTAAVEGATLWIKIEGRACAERAKDFGGAVSRFRAHGVRKVILDLAGCRLMDSTFSGVLTGLVESPGEDKLTFVLVNPSTRVTDLLDNLGVLPLVHVLSDLPDGPGSDSVEEVACGNYSRSDQTACCLEAHRLLMALKPENRSRFADLTRMLENDLLATAGGKAAN